MNVFRRAVKYQTDRFFAVRTGNRIQKQPFIVSLNRKGWQIHPVVAFPVERPLFGGTGGTEPAPFQCRNRISRERTAGIGEADGCRNTGGGQITGERIQFMTNRGFTALAQIRMIPCMIGDLEPHFMKSFQLFRPEQMRRVSFPPCLRKTADVESRPESILNKKRCRQFILACHRIVESQKDVFHESRDLKS
jgi:hypothetical protein